MGSVNSIIKPGVTEISFKKGPFLYVLLGNGHILTLLSKTMSKNGLKMGHFATFRPF